jgi:hypothetical protein
MMEGSGTLEEQLAAIGIKVRHPTFLPIFFTCCAVPVVVLLIMKIRIF